MSTARTIPASPSGASLVTFTVRVEGEPVPRSYNISSAMVSRQVARIARLHLVLLDGSAAASDFPASNEDLFLPGKNLELWGGLDTQESLLFRGILIKHAIRIRESGSPLLLLDVLDKAVKLTTQLKSRYYTDKKDSDVMGDLAAAHGLETDIAETTHVHKQLLQYHATDWDFLVTRAEANGLFCYTVDGKLEVKKPVVEDSAAVELLYGATILEFDAEMDARHQYSDVVTKAWNHSDQALTEVSATDPGIAELGNLSSADLSSVAQEGAFTLLHGGSTEEPQLQAWADAQFLKSKLAKIRGKVRFRGFSGIRPGQTIKLDGVGERFKGNALATGVRHEFFGGSWTTDVQFGASPESFAKENSMQPLPAAGLTPGVRGLQVGVVTDLDDPAGEFRVRVKIPAVSMQDDGAWCRMVMPDAGNNRGFFFRPEVGDEVIVGFLHDDPNHAVILGCVFSSAKGAPLPQNGNNNEKGLVTRSELKWVWNDEKKAVTVQTPAGKTLVLDDSAGEIKLEDETGNKIVMNSEGITIQSPMAIKITAGTNLTAEGSSQAEIKGGAACKVSGSGSAELSSGGNVKVQGAMVQIN
jgi:Rhs element Vgr protein